MRILIVSDTHGANYNLMRVIEKEKDITLMIHLGDLCGLEKHIEQDTGIPCFMVRGNNDYDTMLPSESIIMVGKHKTLLTHGQYFNLTYGCKTLVEYAKKFDCEIVMYGHTHIPEIRRYIGVTAINPGSLTLPRQEDHKPSYIIAETDSDGEVEFTIHYLEENY